MGWSLVPTGAFERVDLTMGISLFISCKRELEHLEWSFYDSNYHFLPSFQRLHLRVFSLN